MEIGIWGDSITYGQCDIEGLGWVGRLRKKFPIDDQIGVYNRGICGDTSEDILKRFFTEAATIQPDIVVFAMGLNDSKYVAGQNTGNVPLEKFTINVKQLITQAKTYTNKIFIVGLTSVSEEMTRASGSRFLNNVVKSYDLFLKELSEKEDLVFIDVFNILDIKTDLADGLHPNAQGYEKLFQAISKFI